MNATTPTLNPFSENDSKQGSNWGLIIVAILLGTATAAGVLLWRWPAIAAATATPPPAQTSPATKTMITAQSKDWDFYTAEIDTLMTELQSERVAYEKKTKDLAAVEMRIETEKKELLRLRGEIEQMRQELTTETTQLQSAERTNVRSLARTYSNMKPTQAVAILAEMSDANIAKLLATMKSDVVAKILGEMSRTVDPAAEPGSKTTLAARAAAISNQLRLFKNEQPPAKP